MSTGVLPQTCSSSRIAVDISELETKLALVDTYRAIGAYLYYKLREAYLLFGFWSLIGQ